jgi:hypothetical protein
VRPNRGSVIEGVIFVVLSCTAIFLGAAYLLVVGWEALSSGEISVFRKGHPSITLTPSSSPWWFYGEVWIRLIAGGLLAAIAVALPLFLALLPPERRANRLRLASLVRVMRGGPNVSLFAMTIVAIAMVVFIYIWMRHVA